ncbi:unnamed protein product [Caenorhabditis nigoni]
MRRTRYPPPLKRRQSEDQRGVAPPSIAFEPMLTPQDLIPSKIPHPLVLLSFLVPVLVRASLEPYESSVIPNCPSLSTTSPSASQVPGKSH